MKRLSICRRALYDFILALSTVITTIAATDAVPDERDALTGRSRRSRGSWPHGR
jgi:hypothetical protein